VSEDSFHVAQTRIDVRLPWHSGTHGVAWNLATGLLKDAFETAVQRAARSRLLSLCPDDALAYHGESLGWPQAPGESTEQYRRRLGRSWHYAQWRGTAKGIIDPIVDILTALAPPGVMIPSNWVEVHRADEPGWGRHSTLFGSEPNRARWFNVVIRKPHPFGTDFNLYYDDGIDFDTGYFYDTNGDGRLLEVIRQVVRRQKPAHSRCEWIAVVLDGDILHAGLATDGDPDGAARVYYDDPAL
jgi:hypothetical protein